MSNENNELTIENFLKKVQEGDNTLLIIGAVLMIVPMITLFFLVGGKADKKATQHKLKTMQRKNVYSYLRKENNKSTNSATKKTSSSSSSSNWSFTPRTLEQKIADELREAALTVERQCSQVRVPPGLTGDARNIYIAEHNYNLSMGNGSLDLGNYREAENYFQKALDEADDNPFLKLYALGGLCAVYEKTGDIARLQEAYSRYFDAIKNDIPPEFGGGIDLKGSISNAYKSLVSVGKYALESELSKAISETKRFKSGIPSEINIRDAYKSFPFKYE